MIGGRRKEVGRLSLVLSRPAGSAGREGGREELAGWLEPRGRSLESLFGWLRVTCVDPTSGSVSSR